MRFRLSFWGRAIASLLLCITIPLLPQLSLGTQSVAAQSTHGQSTDQNDHVEALEAVEILDAANQLVEQARQLQANQQQQAALDLLRQALDLYEQAGDTDTAQAIVFELAQGYLYSGQAQRALPFLIRALEMANRSGPWQTFDEHQQEMLMLHLLGSVAEPAQQTDEILTYLQDQIALFQATGDRPRELLYLNTLARFHSQQREFQQADPLFRQVLTRAEAAQDPWREMEALQGLIELYSARLPPDRQITWIETIDTGSINYAPPLTDADLAELSEAERRAAIIASQIQASLEVNRLLWAHLQSLLAEIDSELQNPPMPLTGDLEDFLASGQFAQLLERDEQQLEEAIANKAWAGALWTLYQLIPRYHMQAAYDDVIRHSHTLLTLSASPDIVTNPDTIPVAFTPENLELYALYFLADAYYALGDESQAIETAMQARDRYQATDYGDSIFPPQSTLLRQTIPGGTAFWSGNIEGAIAQVQRAIDLAQLSNNPHQRALATWALGYFYTVQEDFPRAQTALEDALHQGIDLGDSTYQAYLLSTLIRLYLETAQYLPALRAGEELLLLAQQGTALVSDEQPGYSETAYCVVCVGHVYESLGHYHQAKAFYEQVLAEAQGSEHNSARVEALTSLGNVHLALEEDDQAIAYFQQSLDVYPDLYALAGLSRAYLRVEKPEQALEVASEALRLARQMGLQTPISSILPWLGDVYVEMGDYTAASDAYQESLAIAQTLELPETEVHLLGRIAQLWVAQEQPELAIVFYKQAVNRQEELRQQVRTLSAELQQTYTEAIAPTYRALADLLLQQDRILEAQQVLELLKLQEVDDYLRTVRGSGVESTVIDPLPAEAELFRIYNDKLAEVVALGKELEEILQIEPGDRTPAQEERRQAIEADQRTLIQDFVEFTRSPQVEALVDQLRQVDGGETLEPRLLRTLQDNLQQLDGTAVLLYPLVLEDRLELLLVTPYAPPIRRPVPVSRVDLNQVIIDFRTALEDPSSDATAPAQQLYDWLIRPLETALAEANADTIIYAPDNTLRYIPLAALHDATTDEWLAEGYYINTITALSLTDFNTAPQETRVLAGAFAEGNYSFQVGDRTFDFAGLPHAGIEVETLVATVPDTTSLLDTNFSRETVEAQMSDYSVLHLATHAAFVPGQPDESFIVFGDGARATFRDVELWNLTNTDLVVLSACETAVGANGEELLGFGYLMQQAGARAAIASLWQVSDGGTQALMDAFYAALQQDGITKAEALRQAQVALITGDFSGLGLDERGAVGIRQRIDATVPEQVSQQLDHPYYWAPFILIGNGL